MRRDVLARKADDARHAVEVARTNLERIARRWAERQETRALNELKRAALQFEAAQRALEDALLAWARALRSGEVVMSLVPNERVH